MATSPLPQERSRQIPTLVMFLVIVVGFGSAAGILAGSSGGGWYALLQKPSWNPPSYLFGIVWPILYAMIATALWFIWRQPNSPARSTAMTLFVVQLLVNYAWSFVFFKFHLIGVAAIWIAVLGGLAFTTFLMFRKLHSSAGLLMLPYLAWITFAFVLNSTVWAMNGGL